MRSSRRASHKPEFKLAANGKGEIGKTDPAFSCFRAQGFEKSSNNKNRRRVTAGDGNEQ
jgi:hypothetical protein